MADVASESLRDEFFRMVATGSEQEAKDFLVSHFNEFSKEDQEAIVLAFFEDAAGKQAEGEADVAAFQNEGIALFKGLSDAKKELEKKDALLEAKENL